MNDRDLIYFCHLVEVGNYTQTAADFKITQPAISGAIKRLEKEYGVALLVQHNRRSRLTTTSAGNILYIKAKHLISDLGQIRVEVQQANTGKFRLGFSSIAGGIWLPNIFRAFLADHNLAQITTTEDQSATLLKSLKAGKLDAAILSSLQPLQNDHLRFFNLGHLDFCLIVHPSNPLANQPNIHSSDLTNQRFITRAGNALTQRALQQYAQQNKFHPDIIYRSESTALVRKLVMSNLGIALQINEPFLVDNRNLVKLPITDAKQIQCYMQLAIRKGFIPTKQQERYLTLLKRASLN